MLWAITLRTALLFKILERVGTGKQFSIVFFVQLSKLQLHIDFLMPTCLCSVLLLWLRVVLLELITQWQDTISKYVRIIFLFFSDALRWSDNYCYAPSSVVDGQEITRCISVAGKSFVNRDIHTDTHITFLLDRRTF